MQRRSFLSTILVCATVASFTLAPSIAAETTRNSGINRATFDTSVKPGDDFYEYVNGNWIKENPIPPEYSRWGAFPKLRDDNLIALHEILEDLDTKGHLRNDDERKLRDFYRTAMDEDAIEQAGATPLAPHLKRINDIENRNDLIREVGRLRVVGVDALFSFAVYQDEKHSDQYAAHLNQGGMGLPDRDYYLGKSKDSRRVRDEYHKHVAKMLALLTGDPQAGADGADVVLRIETQLAEKSRTPVQLRDREAQYNVKTVAELSSLAPNVVWKQYLHTVGIKNVSDVIVGQPEFIERVNRLLSSVSLDDWRIYLQWQLVHALAPYLSKNFEDENFRFYSQELRGTKHMQPRWKRVVAVIDGEIGEALGKLYVEKRFPPEAKKRMDEMVKNLLAAYRDRLSSRDWMGTKTKDLALAKLASVLPKIGYPAKWRDYSKLQVGTDSYADNVMRAEAFETHRRFVRLGKPVDRLEWDMTPPTVNAYYNESMNEVVFPAGILQPP
ncbi:MAG TPA: M13 family metallopeptidase, partial [Lacipirellulaceae bacterium]|nr:M13 family metallopeptidase [Lacipirellulaceae bacterium]